MVLEDEDHRSNGDDGTSSTETSCAYVDVAYVTAILADDLLVLAYSCR